MDHISLEQVANKKLTEIDGIIGLSWLRSSVVTFDYQNHTLKISTPLFANSLQKLIAPAIVGAVPKVSIRLPFQLIRQQIILSGGLGEEAVSMQVSTGMNNSVVSADFATDHFKPEQVVKSGEANYVKNLVLDFGGARHSLWKCRYFAKTG